jgi:hypothetical protein
VRLDAIAVAVRPRQPWEAVDLGFTMVRAWWKQVYGPWLLVVLPIMAVVDLMCWEADMHWLAPLLIWWWKPLLDRVPLYVLSHGVFGELPGAAQTLRALPSLWRISPLWRLLLGRFSPTRSFDLPVVQLEGLKGKERAARTRVLQNNVSSAAIWHTIACVHFELVVDLSLFGVVWLFLPQQMQQDLFRGMIGAAWPAWLDWMGNVFYFVSVLLVEPFYVAGGFALYLNRRTLLEGWDIELAFRRLVERASTPSTFARVAGVALLTLMLAIPYLPGDAWAAQQTISREVAKEKIGQVLKGPIFKRTEKVSEWRYIGGWHPDNKDRPTAPGWMKLIESLGRGLALIAKGLLWLAVLAAIIWLIVYRRRWLGWLGNRKPEAAYVAPQQMFGLDVRPESLPEDVAGAARKLWQQHQPRAALSLLYRGALARLIAREGIELRESDTEGDCLRVVAQKVTHDQAEFFATLTRAWENTAYGGRAPDSTEGEAFCAAWRVHFEPRA